MRILVVDDSSPHRRLLTLLLGSAGHEVITAPDGVAALALLEGQDVDAVVSDVRMPKMDGFQLCRTLRTSARWSRLPFIFYSSIFIDAPAHALGMDLGATAYLDAKDVAPGDVAKEVEALVNRAVRDQYTETLGKLRDDAEFTRRYHQVVLSSIPGEQQEVREAVSSSARALDAVVNRLDAERRALGERADMTVEAAELKLLRELGDYLGDKINNPLAVILGSADLLSIRAPGDATNQATERIRVAVERINQVVREIAKRGGHTFPADSEPPAGR